MSISFWNLFLCQLIEIYFMSQSPSLTVGYRSNGPDAFILSPYLFISPFLSSSSRPPWGTDATPRRRHLPPVLGGLGRLRRRPPPQPNTHTARLRWHPPRLRSGTVSPSAITGRRASPELPLQPGTEVSPHTLTSPISRPRPDLARMPATTTPASGSPPPCRPPTHRHPPPVDSSHREPSSLSPVAMEMEPPSTGNPGTLMPPASPPATPPTSSPTPNPQPQPITDRLKCNVSVYSYSGTTVPLSCTRLIDNLDVNRLTTSKSILFVCSVSLLFAFLIIFLLKQISSQYFLLEIITRTNEVNYYRNSLCCRHYWKNDLLYQFRTLIYTEY
jgi:hypothetical protein